MLMEQNILFPYLWECRFVTLTQCFAFDLYHWKKMPLETLKFQSPLIIYKRFNQSKMQHLKKYWVTISVNILNIPKRMENGFFFCLKKLFQWMNKLWFFFPNKNLKCLCDHYKHIFVFCHHMFMLVRLVTRTSYSLWMSVEFGDDLRFFPMWFHWN